MSDTMLHGVLNTPPELWQDSEADINQRYDRYLQASRTIEYLQRELDHLKGAQKGTTSYAPMSMPDGWGLARFEDGKIVISKKGSESTTVTDEGATLEQRIFYRLLDDILRS